MYRPLNLVCRVNICSYQDDVCPPSSALHSKQSDSINWLISEHPNHPLFLSHNCYEALYTYSIVQHKNATREPTMPGLDWAYGLASFSQANLCEEMKTTLQHATPTLACLFSEKQEQDLFSSVRQANHGNVNNPETCCCLLGQTYQQSGWHRHQKNGCVRKWEHP